MKLLEIFPFARVYWSKVLTKLGPMRDGEKGGDSGGGNGGGGCGADNEDADAGGSSCRRCAEDNAYDTLRFLPILILMMLKVIAVRAIVYVNNQTNDDVGCDDKDGDVCSTGDDGDDDEEDDDEERRTKRRKGRKTMVMIMIILMIVIMTTIIWILKVLTVLNFDTL